MTSRFEINKREDAREALLMEKTASFQRWLEETHPEIRFGEALLNEVKDYMQGAFLTAEDADFEYTLSQIDTRYSRQRVPKPAEVKQSLIDEICDLLRSPDGTGREGKYSNFNIDAIRKQMQYWDISKLQARRDAIVRAQALNKVPVPVLKAAVKEARTDRSPYPGFPQLPQSTWNGKTHVPVNAAFFKSLDAYEIRRWNLLYSPEQVNARIQQG